MQRCIRMQHHAGAFTVRTEGNGAPPLVVNCSPLIKVFGSIGSENINVRLPLTGKLSMADAPPQSLSLFDPNA